MSHRLCLWFAFAALCCILGCGAGTTTTETEITLPEQSRDLAEFCRKLGADVVIDVTSVGFVPSGETANAAAADRASKVNDDTLAKLVELAKPARLRSLSLVGTNVTDAGLAHLEDLDHLETLELSNSPQITDAGLEHLKPIRSLRRLIIRGCNQITGPAKDELREFFKEKYKVEQLLVTGP